MIDLTEVRRAAGLTLADIAAELRVGVPLISQWLRRSKPIPAGRIRPLAALLRVDVAALLPLEDKE